MKTNKIKIILTLIFILVVGLLALPQFSFTLGDRIITYPDLNLSALGINVTLGNFVKSKDLYPADTVIANVNFPEELSNEEKRNLLTDLTQKIQKRIDYAGLYDLELKGEFSKDQSVIKITFPEYYDNIKEIAEWITRKGEIAIEIIEQKQSIGVNGEEELEEPQQPTQRELEINDSDFIGSFPVEFYNIYGINSLILQLPEEKYTVISYSIPTAQEDYQTQTGQGALKTAVLKIDGTYAMRIIQHEVRTNQLRALPVYTNTPNLLNRIVKTYFAEEKPLNIEIEIQEEVQPVKRKYIQENGTVLAIMFILSAIILAIYTLRKFGLKGFVTFTLMLTSYILTLVAFLKLSNAFLSSGTIIGFVIAYVLGVITIINIIESRVEEIKEKENTFKLVAFLLVVINIALSRFNLSLGVYTDIVGTILLAGLVLLLNLYLVFKPILAINFDEDLNFKLPFRK